MMRRAVASRGRPGRVVDWLRVVPQLAVRPHRGLERLNDRFGPVCGLGAGPLRYVFLFGPEANRFVLARSELFTWKEAFDSLRIVDGDTALIVSDGPDHERRRRLVAPAFARRQLEAYAATMRANTDAALDRWRPGQVIDLYTELRRAIRRSTIEVLFGPRLAVEEAELGRLLQFALDVVDRPPPMQQLQRLGLPSWRRARTARGTVAWRVQQEIQARRAHHEFEGNDLLSALLASRDADEGGLTDTEICDQVISLMAAGYETTSAAMGWATTALTDDPQMWELAKDSTNLVDGSWRYLDGVVGETLRLYPPAVVVARQAVTPFEFDGHRVPAGSLVLISPYVTHRLPELWHQPLRFDPARWNSDAPNHHRPAPYEFLPFGGGPHRCIGATFATTEMTLILERLLRRCSLRLEHTDRTPVGLAAMRPRRGPFVRIVDVADP